MQVQQSRFTAPVPVSFRFVTGLLVSLSVLCAPASSASDGSKNLLQQYKKDSVTARVRMNWTPVRSAVVLPIKLKWKIHRNGSISSLSVLNGGQFPQGEKRACEAVKRSAPFPALPAGSPESVDVEFQMETTPVLNLTVPQAMKHFGPDARKVLQERCKAAGVSYPFKRLSIIGLKQEKKLLFFAGDKQMKLIASYPFVSYSGVLGPKLKEGDLQIPEGIYKITGFQAYNMLALCVDYPNATDRRHAASDGRTKLGNAILVHGGSKSTGCLVVSDSDMEQLFVAAHDVGCSNCELVIAPCDLTKSNPAIDMKKQPHWLPSVYKSIKERLAALGLP